MDKIKKYLFALIALILVVFSLANNQIQTSKATDVTQTIGCMMGDPGKIALKLARTDYINYLTQSKSTTVKSGMLSETVEKNREITVKTGDQITKIESGSLSETIQKNLDITVKTGNQTTKIQAGGLTEKINLKRDSNAKNIAFTGTEDIILTVGGSKITITSSGITLSSGGSVIEMNASGIKLDGAHIGLNDGK